jgi:hypothetical protein
MLMDYVSVSEQLQLLGQSINASKLDFPSLAEYWPRQTISELDQETLQPVPLKKWNYLPAYATTRHVSP